MGLPLYCKGLTAGSADPVKGAARTQDAGGGEEAEVCQEGEGELESMAKLEKDGLSGASGRQI